MGFVAAQPYLTPLIYIVGALMRMRKLSAPVGAVIDDIDVRRMSRDQWQELNVLFCRFKVLVFPKQSLTPKDQMTFAQLWGPLVRHPYAGMKDYPDIIELSNRGKAKDVNQHWHTDMSYNPAPPKLTLLYALSAPALGGDTAFANQVLAYADLSVGLKQTIDSLHAVHSAAGLANLYGENPAAAPRAEHPVVRTHDETGEKALFVCRAFTQRFRDWSREESAPLLSYLFDHSVRPEYQGRQHWQAGDLVMWDNRALLHFAVHDHGDEPRLIHRLQVEGSIPA